MSRSSVDLPVTLNPTRPFFSFGLICYVKKHMHRKCPGTYLVGSVFNKDHSVCFLLKELVCDVDVRTSTALFLVYMHA